jgi:hypothetical protein
MGGSLGCGIRRWLGETADPITHLTLRDAVSPPEDILPLLGRLRGRGECLKAVQEMLKNGTKWIQIV